MRIDYNKYHSQITELLTQIGNIVGQPVSLVRCIGWDAGSYNVVGTKGYHISGISVSQDKYFNLEATTISSNSLGPFLVVARNITRKATISIHSPDIITSFIISAFPGSCALCISSYAKVNPGFKNRGINKLGLQLRLAIAGATGYTALVCSDKADNEYSIRTIEGAGFTKWHSLTNRRTNRNLNFYIKDIE